MTPRFFTVSTIQPNVRELLGSIHFLSDSSVDIDGIRFYWIGWGSKRNHPSRDRCPDLALPACWSSR